MNPHLTNDELLDRLYGLGEAQGESSRHLQECRECVDRFRSFELRRAEVVAASPLSAEASNEFLAGQRRQIYARLDQPGGLQAAPWAPAALAAGLVLAVGMFLYHPAYHPARQPVHQTSYQTTVRPSPAPRPELTDDQLFSDIYSLEESVEPRAAAPIHALFEDTSGAGEQ